MAREKGRASDPAKAFGQLLELIPSCTGHVPVRYLTGLP